MTTIDTLNGRAVANIRGEMGRRRITQDRLSELLKWPRSNLAAVLTERTRLSLDKLEQIAGVLEVEPSKLLND